MEVINGIVNQRFSEQDFVIEFTNLYDTNFGQTLTRLTDFTGTLTYSGTTTIESGDLIMVSSTIVNDGSVFVDEQMLSVSSAPSAGTFNVIPLEPETMPASGTVNYYVLGADTPTNTTVKVRNAATPTKVYEFKVRANSDGTGSLDLREVVRALMPELTEPFFYFNVRWFYNLELALIGNDYQDLNIFRGGKYENFTQLQAGFNPLGQIFKMFKEQSLGVLRFGTPLTSNQTAVYPSSLDTGLNSLTIGDVTQNFYNYPAITECRPAIYLAAKYGETDAINVTVPVFAFINRLGQYEYVRFNANSVTQLRVTEASTFQNSNGAIFTNDNGAIYEAIQCIVKSDQVSGYILDKLEYQRVIGLLAESPKVWLLVPNSGNALEVRVIRESYSGVQATDTIADANRQIQATFVLCEPLGQPR